jgi:hypothetical protein
MKTITELRQKLVSVFNQLEKGEIDIKQASEMNNTAGKIINTARAQLEYAKLRKESPKISFLKGD